MRKKIPAIGIHCFMVMVLVVALFFPHPLAATGKLKVKSVKYTVKPEYLELLNWRSIGPYRGGRALAVVGHPNKAQVFYFGGAGSGIWKTTNGGKTWENVSDGFFKTSSVGAITLAPSDPETIYVGMGECCPRGDISHGDGVYKSQDGGKTWQHMGLAATRHIARICVHPTNSDIVYVAALGHIFGPNQERGIFRSLDGGKTWKKILFRSPRSGAVDLVMNPDNPRMLYAAFWQVQRLPWGFMSGGPECGIYKTSDAGKTWQEITNKPGLPSGIKGRIGLTLSAANPERIYAIVEAKKKGIYRSEDGGEKWQLISQNPQLHQRPWYYHHIKADPTDAEVVFVMNVGFWRSADGGKTFKRISTPHGDNHDLWIDPTNARRMVEANDGGATITFDGGKSWSSIYNQPTAQFYHVTTDRQFPYRVYGAQQDNSTISVPSRSRRGLIDFSETYAVGGCECGYIAVRPDNSNIIYAGCYGGTVTRYNHTTRTIHDISVWPDNPMGWSAEKLKYRFQWTFPIYLSPFDANTLYVAGNRIFRSTDEGKSWDIVSPDLTRNDTAKMGPSGGSLTHDNTSVEYYGTVFALAESPLKQGLLWAGSDDGLIHVSHDNGKTWRNVTPGKLPPWALISIIEPSFFDAATAYVAATRYKHDDYRPYLYKTTDFGKSWQKITAGFPADDFTRVIREDPQQQGLLYAGTETGVYFSTDGGKFWQSLQINLPVTPIHDLVVHHNDLVVGTHGRSFWILDDLGKLHQLLKQKVLPPLFLFKPAVTVRTSGRAFRGKEATAGISLPPGVIVNFYLQEKGDTEIKLQFLDENKHMIRTYSSKTKKKGEQKVPCQKGMNQFVWNLSFSPARQVQGAVFWGPSSVVPKAVPGSYFVRLQVGDQVLEQPFSITKKVNTTATLAGIKEQFNLLIKIRDKVSLVHDCINEIRSIRKQLNWYLDQTKGKPTAAKVGAAAKQIKDKLFAIEDELIQHRAKARQDLLNFPIKLNNKLTALAGVIQRNEGSPTSQARKLFQELSIRIDGHVQKLKGIITNDLPVFNQLIHELKIPALVLKHLKKD